MDAADRKAKQQRFLDALGECMSIKEACRLSGIPRSTVYHWRDTNKRFRKLFDQANEEANDTIDDEIRRRGYEGIEEPLVSMGRLVYLEEPLLDEQGKPMLDKQGKPILYQKEPVKVRKYSDSLLLALAKSRMKKYRDRVDLDLLEQINESTGGTITLNTKELTGEELAQLKQLAQSIKARQESAEKHDR
jgi:hypothetical protein